MNIYTVLAQPGAEVTLNGLYMAGGSQHLDHQTRIEHVAPNCTSHEVYKGSSTAPRTPCSTARSTCTPRRRRPTASRRTTTCCCPPDAHVDTKPQLEIFADDVKCTHGATVGQLDEMALFYLRSRGLALDEAKTLLTYAFAPTCAADRRSHVRAGLEALARERFVGAMPASVG